MQKARLQSGFTLIEAIMVITITGIVAGMVAVFLRAPVNAYFDTSRRAELTDIADTAARYLARDVQSALPNSLRVDGTGKFVEFVPVKAAGRYCIEAGAGATWASTACADPLDFGAAGDTFDVFGPPVRIDANDSLVIYNLGIAGSDVYDGSSRRAGVANAAAQSNIGFAGAAFPLESPSRRFFVVATPVSYACDLATGRMLRYAGYAIPAAQPATLAALNALATPAVLATSVTACSITYTAGAMARDGLVVIALSVTQSGETVTLQHQVSVSNTP